MPGVRVDLMAYLFGDLLAVVPQDLLWIYGGGVLVALALWRLWDPLLAMTVSQEMAQVEGLNVGALRAALMILTALVIAVAMKFVGALLITSLLIIPPRITSYNVCYTKLLRRGCGRPTRPRGA